MEGALSREELERIDCLALRLIKNGEHNELDEWMLDARSLPRCKQILDMVNVPYYAGCFAMQTIKKHVTSLFDYWSIEDQWNFAGWYDSLVNSQYALLWEDKHFRPIFSLYTKLYGLVMAKGWNADKNFQNMLGARLDMEKNEINYVFCAALGDIAQEMAQIRNTEFRTTAMPFCLDYAFCALRKAGEEASEQAANVALDAIHNILNYEVVLSEAQADKFPNDTYSFSLHCLEICCSLESVATLFSVAVNCSPDKCLAILTLLSSANSVSVARDQYEGFLLAVLGNLLQIPIKNAVTFLHAFTRAALRLKVALKSSTRYDLPSFMTYMIALTTQQMGNIAQESNAISNLLSFWATFEDIDNVEVLRMRLSVAKNFIEKSLDAIDNGTGNFEMIEDLFSLNNSKNINPMCLALWPIIGHALPEFTDRILRPIYKGITQSTSENVRAQMAFFCNCILGMTFKVKVGAIDHDPNAETMIGALRELFKLLLFEIYQPHYESEYVVSSLILFIRQFHNYDFMCQCGSCSQAFYKEFGDIDGIESMLNSMFTILWEVLAKIENPQVLLDATLAL